MFHLQAVAPPSIYMRGPIAQLEEEGNCHPRAPPLHPPVWQVLVQDGAPSPGNLLEEEEDHMAFLLHHLEYLCQQLLGEAPLLR